MQQANHPTLFLPGTLCDERIWQPLWHIVADNMPHRTYVPLQWANDLEQMLALTNDRINQYDQKVHLVGYSMGAYIASLAALATNKVAKLTLIGYSPNGLSEQEMNQRKAIIHAIDNKTYKGMTKLRLKQFLTDRECENKALNDTVLSMSNDLGGATLRAQIKATTPRKDLTRKLQQSKLPIHCIAAEQDKIAPCARVKAFASASSHIQYTLIKDTAHMMLLAKPNQISNAILD
jgi:pimeloyl-ACP methyl ester carboxylesterase